MRKFPTSLLIAIGFFLILTWLVYATVFAGIPYPDPTPEMAANYSFHTRVSNIILALGLGTLVVGMISRVSSLLLKKLGKTEDR